MRTYAKVSSQFWIGFIGKIIKKLGGEAQRVALYLISCPSSTMLGIYYLPVSTIAYDVGISIENATKALRSLCEIDFCTYDEEKEYVWVHEMAFYQIGELKPNDNRVKGIQKTYQSMPNLSFLQQFFDKYQSLFYLKTPRQISSTRVSTSSRISQNQQGQKYEQELEQTQPIEETLTIQGKVGGKKEAIPMTMQLNSSSYSWKNSSQDLLPTGTITQVFEHWKKTLEHPQALLDKKRQRLICQALKMGYTISQLCDAITGCSLTPHNMGQNDRNQRYDGLHIILRDADQIDRFIRNCHHPVTLGIDPLLQANLAAGQRWLNKKIKEAKENGNV